MRKSLGVCLLVLLLTSSASAGEIPNLSPARSANVGGEIPNDAPDSLTEIVLQLLAALL